MYRAICAPDLFAGVFVVRRYKLLFLVIVDDHDEVVHKRGGRCCSEIEDRREAFERGVLNFPAIEIVGEEAQIGDVDVDAIPVGDGSFGSKTVLAMAAAGRATRIELAFPVDLAGVEVERIQEVV